MAALAAIGCARFVPVMADRYYVRAPVRRPAVPEAEGPSGRCAGTGAVPPPHARSVLYPCHHSYARISHECVVCPIQGRQEYH